MAIEQGLVNLLGQALPDLDLHSSRNQYTNMILTDISTLLEHLFMMYGSIEPEEFKDK